MIKTLALTTLLSLNVHAGCLDNVNVFLYNSQMLVKRLSMNDLAHVIQRWMDDTNQEQGYLTGLRPDWNATRIEELAIELDDSFNAATKYRNIVGNLDHEGHLMQFQELGIEIDEELLITFLEDTRLVYVFREWRLRLKEGEK